MTTLPLDLGVDRASEMPLGLQLAWRLRAQIAGGGLAPAEQLPSVRELAAAARVNVNTVRAVYRRLEDEGYVVSRHGLGTFVAPDPPRTGIEIQRMAAAARAEALAHGLDPRELAAALHASADLDPQSEAAPQRALPTPDTDERAARRTLRKQIGKLEHELASYARSLPPEEPTHPLLRPKPHLTDLEELEAIRDRLLDRLAEARRAEETKSRHRQAAREHLESLVRNPEQHKWQWVSNEDLGEPGCKYWYSRPRWGVLGAMMGWWRVKVSSGCPLAGAWGGDTDAG